jgi:hypothetical protein
MNPRKETGPANGTLIFSLPARRGAVGRQQGKQAEYGRTNKCQENTIDLRRSVISRLDDQIALFGPMKR